MPTLRSAAQSSPSAMRPARHGCASPTASLPSGQADSAPESSRPVPAPDSRRASVLLADLVVILTGCAQSVSYDKAFSLALGTRGGGLGTIPGGQQVGPGHQARADERAHDRVLRVAAAVGTVLPGRPGSSAAPRLAGGLAVARPLARR